MPQVGFICPRSGTLVTHEQCLAVGFCADGERCAPYPILELVSKRREWKGRPSVTQLLKGTREAYLELTCPYHVSVDDQMFRLAGTVHHKKLERAAQKLNVLQEETFTTEDIHGTADLIYPVEVMNGEEVEGVKGPCWHPDLYELIDYKNQGAFKVGQYLGLFKVAQPTGEFFKTGPKKGMPKTKNVIMRDPQRVNMREQQLQLCKYKQFAEAAGFKIHRMRLWVTVRDGGVRAAQTYGVERKGYFVTVPPLPDEQVKAYFERRRAALMMALESGKVPAPCTDEERWANNKKCLEFCNVAQYCDFAQQLTGGNGEDE
jgi:hypothetical protein